jgi:hypothetical protein
MLCSRVSVSSFVSMLVLKQYIAVWDAAASFARSTTPGTTLSQMMGLVISSWTIFSYNSYALSARKGFPVLVENKGMTGTSLLPFSS